MMMLDFGYVEHPMIETCKVLEHPSQIELIVHMIKTNGWALLSDAYLL